MNGTINRGQNLQKAAWRHYIINPYSALFAIFYMLKLNVWKLNEGAISLHSLEQGGPVKLDSMWQHRLTRPLHVQHTYYCIIYKQNLFNIISRGVQR